MGINLNDFAFPIEAQEQFVNKGLTQRDISGGVSTFDMAGHDRGIAFRFFKEQVKNEMKSLAVDMEIPDEIHMIEWNVSKKHKPAERVHMIGDKLLKFRKVNGRIWRDANGQMECTGGLYSEQYIAWTKGLNAPGLSLSRWGKITDSQVFTLASLGIFTVEQFAAMPRNSVEGRFPKDLVEVWESSIQWLNAQEGKANIDKYASKIVSLEQENAKKDEAIKTLQAQMAQLLSEEKPEKKKPGRKPKNTEETAHVD